jgi:hypothetical protein
MGSHRLETVFMRLAAAGAADAPLKNLGMKKPGSREKKPGFSALGGTRTPNLLIRSQMLYPLSYKRKVDLDESLLSISINERLMISKKSHNRAFKVEHLLLTQL